MKAKRPEQQFFIYAMGSLHGDLPGTIGWLSDVSVISMGEYYALLSMSRQRTAY